MSIIEIFVTSQQIGDERVFFACRHTPKKTWPL